jgi:hypothetical protein
MLCSQCRDDDSDCPALELQDQDRWVRNEVKKSGVA